MVITKLDYILGSFLCILSSFLRSSYRMGDIFGLLKFQIFFRVNEIPEFLRGEM